MKILFLFLTPLLILATEVDDVLQKLLTYKSDKTKLHVAYNPFVLPQIQQDSITGATTDVEQTNQLVPVRLKAILNNKAFIDNGWRGIGDMLGDAKIIKISETAVYLQKTDKVETLELTKFKKYVSTKDKSR